MKNISLFFQRNWFGLFLAVVSLYFLFQQCELRKQLESSLTAKLSENKTYLNEIGTLTTRANDLILDNQMYKDLIEKKDDTISKLAKSFSQVKTIIKIKTVTQIDTIKQTFKIPIPCAFIREDSTAQEWYSFKYRIDSTGFKISNFKIPNKQVIINGFQRKWFLGKQTLTTEVTNTNPLITIKKVDVVTVVVPKKWHDSKLLWLGAGFVTGVIIK
jgi:hypothetical protein